MPCFVAQSFVLAAFATLVCQRNCVFLCKGTKLQKAGLFAAVCRFSLWSVFGGAGVGVADKPRNVLCSFYVVLTGVWGWLGSQGEPRLCFFFHLFYMLPHQ